MAKKTIPKYQLAGSVKNPVNPFHDFVEGLNKPKPKIDVYKFPKRPKSFQEAQQTDAELTLRAQQKAEQERVAQLQAHNQQVSATRAIDEGTYFTLPDGSTKKHSDMDFREKRYVEGQALRNRFKWDNDNPEETAWYNPLALVGNMAANLAEAPYVAKQTDSYMPYITSVGLPLVLGRAVGSGSINPFSKGFYTNTIPTKQFVNNLVNPLAGVGDLVNNLGNKYLPNAYKLNPFAFKPNSEMGYRMLGKEGFDDAISTGTLRAKPTPNKPVEGISLQRNTNRNPNTGKLQGSLDRPYFADGVVDERYAADYMAAVNKVDNNLVQIPTHKGIAPQQAGSIPLENATLYKKDWLRGYKEVSKPKSNFQSEIDWAKWNKEIPENTQLMKEYTTIEQTSKANGSWMKNPDGSKFQGTPEQFIQQNSENFKKAFGNSKLVNPDGSPTIQYHGSAKKFDTFDESKFQLGDSGYSGQGIYTTPSKTTANSYATSSAKFHKGDIEPTVYELYGQANNPISSSQLIKENKGRDLFNFHRKKNWKGDLTPEESLMDYDAAIADQLPNVESIRPWNDAREIVFPTNKQLKSAVGNNGMFDMTNPNIYKALVPTVGAGVALSQKQQGGIAIDPLGYYNPKNPKDQPILIPSNSITMKDQKGKKKLPNKLWAFPNNNAPVLMEKGQDYYFPQSSSVLEVPAMQFGGSPFGNVRKIKNSTINYYGNQQPYNPFENLQEEFVNSQLNNLYGDNQKQFKRDQRKGNLPTSMMDVNTGQIGWSHNNQFTPNTFFQKGGKIQPLIVNNPNDKRLKASLEKLGNLDDGEYEGEHITPELINYLTSNGYKVDIL